METNKMEHRANEEMLAEYMRAKDDLRSSLEERIVQARESFLRLKDYKNSAILAQRCETLLSFRLGNRVCFGTYQGTPIYWRVVDASGKMRMLLAEDVVLERAYNEQRVDCYWQNVTLRKYLNGAFLQEAFTPEERRMILNARRTNECNEQFYTNGGSVTMDKVFILSKKELDTYLPESEPERRALGRWWWLRTPGDNLLAVTAVDADGSVYMHGVNVNYPNGGVRPAMWILLRDA